jgi:hypothetical protein
MDGATKMNPSDTPHNLTALEEKKVKRSIAKEATVAEKHVSQAGKALKSAENDEGKAEKVCLPIQVGMRHLFSVYVDAVGQATQKAHQVCYKAVKREHSTAQALGNAQHKHDLAIADEHKAANDLSVRIVIVVTLAQAVLTICKLSCVVSRSLVCFLLQMRQKHLQEAHRAIESRRTELEQVRRKKNSGDVSI